MTPRSHNRDVAITGLGIISPLGLDAETCWRNLCEGRSGIRPIRAFDATAFPCRIAGEAWNFDPRVYLSAKEASRSARFVQFALAAASEAAQGAQLKQCQLDGSRIGIFWGTGSGGASSVDSVIGSAAQRGWMSVEPLALLKVLPDSAANALAQRFGAHGPVRTTVAACVSSTLAVVQGARFIRDGAVDVAICGGCEAWITPMGIGSFALLHALSTTRNNTPESASRPFDADRDGFVPAEGAGAVILESLDHALKRGANLYAIVSGTGSTNDGYHPVAPDPSGTQAARAIALALDDAAVAPQEIDYVNAHGTATVLNDVAETTALKIALGDVARRVPISATKSMTGHGLGASGVWELIATALSIRDGVVHPTINLDHPDPACDLDYVPWQCRDVQVRTALKTSFGFGGQNVALVLRSPPT